MSRNLLRRIIKLPYSLFRFIVIKIGVICGFVNYNVYHVHGPKERLIIKDKNKVSLVNTIFNTRSGRIYIGENVIFGHNCMVLTGRHDYRDALTDPDNIENVPEEGYDIIIKDGVWVASGVILIAREGGLTIGKHCVIASGSIVIDNIPDYAFVAGFPAQIKNKN